jgi:hypothetical protein
MPTLTNYTAQYAGCMVAATLPGFFPSRSALAKKNELSLAGLSPLGAEAYEHVWCV